MKFLVLVLLAVTAQIANATDEQRPVLVGSRAKVVNTKLVRSQTTNQSEIIATVTYNPICTPPTSFMIVNVSNGVYEIYQGKAQPQAGVSNCFAIAVATQDLNLGPVPDTELEPIMINGEPVK